MLRCAHTHTHTLFKRNKSECALCKRKSVRKTGWVAHVTADGGLSRDESEIAQRPWSNCPTQPAENNMAKNDNSDIRTELKKRNRGSIP